MPLKSAGEKRWKKNLSRNWHKNEFHGHRKLCFLMSSNQCHCYAVIAVVLTIPYDELMLKCLYRLSLRHLTKMPIRNAFPAAAWPSVYTANSTKCFLIYFQIWIFLWNSPNKVTQTLNFLLISGRMLMLQYSKHGECILEEIGAAFRGEHPSDLLLVCEGKETLKAHKLVLAAASPLIR